MDNRAQDAFIGHFEDVLGELCKYFPIAAVGVESRPSSEQVRRKAGLLELNVSETNSDADIKAMLSGRKYRYLFVASYGIILKQDTIDSVETVINYHMGLLPECRGRHPLPAAILHGHTRMGVTAHIITDERIDAGPIIDRKAFPIDYQGCYSDNEKRLRSAIPELVRKTYDMHIAEWRDLSEAEGPSQYYPPLSRQRLDDIFNASSLTSFRP